MARKHVISDQDAGFYFHFYPNLALAFSFFLFYVIDPQTIVSEGVR